LGRAGAADRPPRAPIVAALIDDELRELTYHIEKDVAVTPLGMDDRDGSRIYRRSLTFLLVVAARELFPEARLSVDHSVTFGGYYCEVHGRPPFTAEEHDRLEARMREIVAADEPIGKERAPLADAVALFRDRGDDEVVQLLTYRRKDYLVLYTLRGMRDYFHGYMAPSTGYLRYFALHPYPPGFILRFPRAPAWSSSPSSPIPS
jgi:uridine kinase